MSMPQIPRLTIYEDFDKIYGKEVCFGQQGEKIIVKLLHYSHLEEDQQQLLMSDESGEEVCISNSDDEKTHSSHSYDPQHQSIPKQRKKSSSKKKFDEQRKISLSKISELKGETSTHSDTPFDFLRQIKANINHGSPNIRTSCTAINGNKGGYAQYEMSFLQVPVIKDYGEASSDDLSSEWDSDQTETKTNNNESKPITGWRKLRNIVTWTPFFQTYKKQRYAWVQLAGHQGNFKAGNDPGTILKKSTQREAECFNLLMKDVLRAYTPQYFGLVKAPDATQESDDSYLQLQDLLTDFKKPCCVMDLKIGLRTYLIEELEKAKEKQKLRKDMYEKMIQIDVNAPTEEENLAKGVTKPRYMCWRETISSTATLGFRIEGIKKDDGTTSKDFKTLKQRSELVETFKEFVKGYEFALPKYIQRLKAIRATLEFSEFFRSHEIIGSSLLFVHDSRHASIWLIDFAKTILLPENTQITHDRKWEVGNHEDGYLIGLNNLIEIFTELLEDSNAQVVERKHSQSSSSSDGKN